MSITQEDKRLRIQKWVATRAASSKPKHALKFFTLLDAGARQSVVETFDVTSGEVDPLEIAVRILDTAREDAEQHSAPGTSSRLYYVRAYFGNDPRPADGRLSFYMETRQSDSEGSDYAPQTGNLSMDQALRSQERLTALYLAGMQSLLSTQQQMTTQLRAENEGLQERTVGLISTYSQMLDRKSERELALREIESNEMVKKAAIDKFLPYAAAFAQKLIGVKADDGSSPGQAEAVLASAHQLLGSLRPDQIGQLQSILDPNQQLAVMQLMQSAESAQNQAKAEKVAQSARQLTDVLPESPKFVPETS